MSDNKFLSCYYHINQDYHVFEQFIQDNTSSYFNKLNQDDKHFIYNFMHTSNRGVSVVNTRDNIYSFIALCNAPEDTKNIKKLVSILHEYFLDDDINEQSSLIGTPLESILRSIEWSYSSRLTDYINNYIELIYIYIEYGAKITDKSMNICKRIDEIKYDTHVNYVELLENINIPEIKEPGYD